MRSKPFPRGYDIAQSRKALAACCPEMRAVIKRIKPFEIPWHRPFDPMDALARSIIFQQLSGKAASTIVKRIEAILPNGPRIRAQDILKTKPEKLRACGVSGNKQLALFDLAEKSLQGLVPSVQAMRWLNDAEIIERITQVRGIGPWTVQMMLLFRLGRADVWPVADLAVQKGVQITLNLEQTPKPTQMHEIGERWAPHRSLAALYCWRVVDQDGGNG